MPAIHLTALFCALLAACCYQGFLWGEKTIKKENGRGIAILLFLAALLVRLLAAARSEGFDTDISCFAAWAERMHTVGASGFYSPEVFTDYPPGYMYVLGVIGWLRSALDIPYLSAFHLILLKLPAMACDLLCGWLLYREAEKRFSGKQALFLCGAYLFNPVILLNSAVWGQVDSVFTLALLLLCLSLVKGRLFPAYLAFCGGLLLKPQMLLFSPILLAGMADQAFPDGFSLRRLGRNLLYGLLSLGGFVCLCAPFGLENVWKQYFSTVESYPYAAVNACNFWGMLGLNWVSQDTLFLGIPYKFYGYAFILLTVVLVLAMSLLRRKDREKYPFLAAVLILTLFVFSVRMHERYLYPGLALLLLAFLYKPVRSIWLCYGGFSALHFYNTAFVLFFYDPQSYDRKAPLLVLVSMGMVLMAYVLHRFGVPQYFSHEEPVQQQSGGTRRMLPEAAPTFGVPDHIADHSSRDPIPMEAASLTPASQNAAYARYAPRPSRRPLPVSRADLCWMAVITLVYGCFALYDLGDTAAPESRYDMQYGDTVTLRFDGAEAASIAYYIAPGHNRNFTVTTESQSGGEWSSHTQEIAFANVFTWQTVTLEEPGSKLRLTLTDDAASLLELVFLDGEDNALAPVNASDYPALFDEQSLYPQRASFRNGMYFDEIYHGRTAYEFLNGLTAYETTHPPLGKIFIGAGVALFGMNPFGWRIAGTILGILMVPVIYLFGKKLTENTAAAALACVLFTFDFMHFTQTRIATIDVYVTFFVLLMYVFMYCYSRKSFYDTPLSQTFLPLGACGVCMGLGIACKWTGIYAGAGLALIFFAVLFRRYREYRYAKAAPEGISDGISHRHILESFLPCTVKTLAFCVVFFVGIPALIYLLSYLPFRGYTEEGLFARMLHSQTAMFNYHSTLNATHPYSSPWYQWPLIIRPVWYYSSIVSGTYGAGGLREGISAFGNPLVWWPGIPAALYMLRLWILKRDRTAAFLLVGYLAQYLPWFFVTRITFIYHYFPSVPFVALMIAYGLLQAKQRAARSANCPYVKKKLPARGFRAVAVPYGMAVFLLFLLFYPVLSGQAVDASYVNRWLRWFGSWVLTAP
ncbi:MAG: phospholipid carrier-dependent glycosyltransferase [Blautia sp.]|nr:phospholipid carrier-dependent glycosyltransferase [Blautia sp.]